jgi:hypothetical protein
MKRPPSRRRIFAPDQPHAKYPHVYAIVRFDQYVSLVNLEHCATVVKVLPTRDLAEQETERLRRLNKGKGCTYVVQTTRFIGEGWRA